MPAECQCGWCLCAADLGSRCLRRGVSEKLWGGKRQSRAWWSVGRSGGRAQPTYWWLQVLVNQKVDASVFVWFLPCKSTFRVRTSHRKRKICLAKSSTIKIMQIIFFCCHKYTLDQVFYACPELSSRGPSSLIQWETSVMRFFFHCCDRQATFSSSEEK